MKIGIQRVITLKRLLRAMGLCGILIPLLWLAACNMPSGMDTNFERAKDVLDAHSTQLAQQLAENS